MEVSVDRDCGNFKATLLGARRKKHVLVSNLDVWNQKFLTEVGGLKFERALIVDGYFGIDEPPEADIGCPPGPHILLVDSRSGVNWKISFHPARILRVGDYQPVGRREEELLLIDPEAPVGIYQLKFLLKSRQGKFMVKTFTANGEFIHTLFDASFDKEGSNLEQDGLCCYMITDGDGRILKVEQPDSLSDWEVSLKPLAMQQFSPNRI